MKVLNPSTNEVIKEIAETSSKDILLKFEAAKQAQKTWSQKSLEERVAVVKKFYDLLEKERETLAKDLHLESGKPLQEATNEVNGARKRILFFINESHKWLKEEKVNVDGNTTEVLAHEPLGVVANISAWNYPFLVGVNVFIPALIAGNAVMYKPSEFALLTGEHIARLWKSAGLPENLFQIIYGAKTQGEALLELSLDGVFFTGSYATGASIAQKVALKLIPVGLELGGKDPLYVTDEISDIKHVAEAVAEGCFYNNGQSCCAVERVYVHEKVYDQFMQEFVAAAKAFPTGSITRASHLKFLTSQVDDAVKKGAQLVLGGKVQIKSGNFFEKTVLANVTHKMRVMKEETFGPLIGVQKVKDDEEAIKLMNDCEYGLTASVYSKNIERAKKIVAKVDAGTAYINCCDRVSPYLPWSGRRNSGLGSTLSYLGILAFTKPRGWHIRQ